MTASVPRAGVARIGSLEIPLPDVQSPTRVRVALELKGTNGRTLARNFQDLFAFPATSAPANIVVSRSGWRDDGAAMEGRRDDVGHAWSSPPRSTPRCDGSWRPEGGRWSCREA